MDGTLLPALLTAGAMGSFGWCWHLNLERAARRHARCEAAAGDAGWCYEPGRHGFVLTGRTLTCAWTLRSDARAGARATLFSLGAPDERRAMLALGTGAPVRVLPHVQRWPSADATLHRRVWIEAHAPEDAQRVVDGETSGLIAAWVAPHRAAGGRALHAWLSPHGVELVCPHGLRDWSEIEPLVRLGLALGRRAGLA